MKHVGVTEEEKLRLHTEYPLSSATKEMLGLAPGSPIHPSEDENTIPPSSDRGDEAGEEVDGPLAMEGVAEDASIARSESWSLVDKEGSEYNTNGSK